ncbi:unnamed protein product [Amoebophrya sp. A120]|nr:unnamed protein product [Amoebophrya sp. A120]|eukprot:GSA120T00020245001.1
MSLLPGSSSSDNTGGALLQQQQFGAQQQHHQQHLNTFWPGSCPSGGTASANGHLHTGLQQPPSAVLQHRQPPAGIYARSFGVAGPPGGPGVAPPVFAFPQQSNAHNHLQPAHRQHDHVQPGGGRLSYSTNTSGQFAAQHQPQQQQQQQTSQVLPPPPSNRLMAKPKVRITRPGAGGEHNTASTHPKASIAGAANSDPLHKQVIKPEKDKKPDKPKPVKPDKPKLVKPDKPRCSAMKTTCRPDKIDMCGGAGRGAAAMTGQQQVVFHHHQQSAASSVNKTCGAGPAAAEDSDVEMNVESSQEDVEMADENANNEGSEQQLVMKKGRSCNNKSATSSSAPGGTIKNVAQQQHPSFAVTTNDNSTFGGAGALFPRSTSTVSTHIDSTRPSTRESSVQSVDGAALEVLTTGMKKSSAASTSSKAATQQRGRSPPAAQTAQSGFQQQPPQQTAQTSMKVARGKAKAKAKAVASTGGGSSSSASSSSSATTAKTVGGPAAAAPVAKSTFQIPGDPFFAGASGSFAVQSVRKPQPPAVTTTPHSGGKGKGRRPGGKPAVAQIVDPDSHKTVVERDIDEMMKQGLILDFEKPDILPYLVEQPHANLDQFDRDRLDAAKTKEYDLDNYTMERVRDSMKRGSYINRYRWPKITANVDIQFERVRENVPKGKRNLQPEYFHTVIVSFLQIQDEEFRGMGLARPILLRAIRAAMQESDQAIQALRFRIRPSDTSGSATLAAEHARLAYLYCKTGQTLDYVHRDSQFSRTGNRAIEIVLTKHRCVLDKIK